ncbi:MAG: hypothetical protein NTV00_05430 [Methylococcales bacterium]|nr:hypothetical protein [Methylococcales bacterium]
MKHTKSYLNNAFERPVPAIVKGIDRDVEQGEDVLMLGLGVVMTSSLFAPIAPPTVVLPLMALTFVISVTVARINYHRMEQKLLFSMQQLNGHELALLHPIAAVFKENPADSLGYSFNPLKNLKRTAKSFLGGLLINPLWMPIFYVMGLQIIEEKNLAILNKAIMGVEQKIGPGSPL